MKSWSQEEVQHGSFFAEDSQEETDQDIGRAAFITMMVTCTKYSTGYGLHSVLPPLPTDVKMLRAAAVLLAWYWETKAQARESCGMGSLESGCIIT